VEEAQSKQDAFELVLLVALVNETLVELGVRSPQVGFQVLRVFIRHFDAGLQQ
jgi:hypothetical protein